MTCLYKCFFKIKFPDRDLDTERVRYNKKLEIDDKCLIYVKEHYNKFIYV